MVQLKDFIVKSKLGNTDENQKMGNSSFDTQDYVFLETLDDVKNLEFKQRYTDVTDYVAMNDIALDKKAQGTGKRRYAPRWTRTAESGADVFISGNLYEERENSPSCEPHKWMVLNLRNDFGICPALHLNISAVLSAQKAGNNFKIEPVLDGNGKELYHTIEFGSYPQDKVKEDMAQKLEKLFQNKKLTPTGKSYQRFCTVDEKYKRSPEFEFEGKKYARVSVAELDDDSLEYKSYTMWVKVQPIKWVIKNWNELPKELNPSGIGTAKTIFIRTEKVLLTGFCFFPMCNGAEKTMWQNSPIRAYLNGYDLYEELNNGNGNVNYKADRNFDFKNNNFLNEAFNQKVLVDLPSTQSEQDCSNTDKSKRPLSPAEIARNELIKKALERRKQAQQSNSNSEDNENIL